MTTVTNKQRAQWASAAIERYNEAREGRTMPYDTIENVVTDLFCDLMHYARRHDFDLVRTFDRAESVFADDEMERAMDLVHEFPCFVAAMKKARDELRFLQGTGARGTNDTETRAAISAIEEAIAKAEGDAP